MGATFSRIKNWISNEVLTAADLNAEFNNIVNNFTPNGLDDYSPTATTMRATANPYPGGSESLPTDLAGEIQRLRFVLQKLGGGQYWYTDGVVLFSDMYADINTAVSNIGSSTVNLIVRSAETLTSNLTVPSNINLIVLNGGSIVKDSTYTVTINGQFVAGGYSVFSGFSSGDVVFGAGSTNTVYPEWFGAVGDDSTDDTSAFTVALGSTTNVKRFSFLSKTYKLTSSLTVPANVSISGTSTNKGILKFYGCDGLTLTSSGAFAPQIFKDFYVKGDSTTTNSYTGIIFSGDADTTTKINNLSIFGVKITNFNMGISLRTAWYSNIYNVAMLDVFHGIEIKGQCVRTVIRDNNIVRNDFSGSGTSVGIEVKSTSDYNPGGTTEHRPESITIDNNFVYGFGYAVELTNILESRVVHNDFDNSLVKGINVINTPGNCFIQDNWIATSTNNTAFIGIHMNALLTQESKTMVIDGNYILCAVSATNSIGIKNQQSNVNITNNTITGFDLADIQSVSTEIGTVNINGNICESTTTTTIGIQVQDSVAGSITNVNDNNVKSLVYVHPTANAGMVTVGKNNASNATYIQGYLTIPSGTTTSGAINYSTLTGYIADFNSASGVVPVAKVFTDSSTGGASAGFTWAEAGDSSITIKSSSAYGGGDYKVYFEVFGMPAFLR